MASSTHVTLPKTFDTGKASEWFQRLEICCRANGWDNDKMALKLTTLLEGEALTVWLELSPDEQKNYAVTKKKIIDAIQPMSCISLDDFHKSVLRPEEPLSLYVHKLKQLLTQAMPGISAETSEQLLLHQSLTGLPREVSKQLRATGATTTLKTAVEQAKIIMTVEQHTPAAAAQSQPSNEFHQLQQQISELTAQVAALSTQQSRPRTTSFVAPRSKRCFLCNKIGHLQYNCPTHQDPRFCFTCGQQGHGWRTCPQGNGQGRLPEAVVIPVSKPTTGHCDHSEEQCHSDQWDSGGVAVEIMLDIGSAVSLLRHTEALSMNIYKASPTCSSIKLVTASGEPLPIISCIKATVNVKDKFATSHQF